MYSVKSMKVNYENNFKFMMLYDKSMKLEYMCGPKMKFLYTKDHFV